MKAFFSIYRSQARLFFRDRVTVALTLLLPLLLSVFFGLMFASNSGAAVKIALVNQDAGTSAQAIVKSFVDLGNSSDLTVTVRPEKEAMDALEKGDVDLVMVMPDGLSDAVTAKRAYSMRAVYDTAKSETAQVASVVADNAVARLNLGLAKAPSSVTLQSVDRSAGKPSLAEYYIPNFLAISTLWLSIFATALPLVKQRQDKALLRIGIAPVSKGTFMGGITLWRITVGVAQSLVFLGVAAVILKADVLARWPLFALAIVLGNLVFTLMAYMIAALSRTVQSAEGIAQVFNFAFMFLSGVFFAQGMLPEFVQRISYFIPLTYLADLFRQLMVGYPPQFSLWVSFAVLGGCGLLFGAISLKAWRWN